MTATESPLPNPEPAESSSLGTRLFNVVAAPGELFEELSAAPTAHTNWVVPLLLSMATGIVFSIVVFSQPDILSGMTAQQEQALAARVAAGQMTAEQAERALDGMRMMRSARFMMIMGSAGAVVGGAVFFVIVALLVWMLAAKILRGGTTLAKAFELAGLAEVIHVVGGLLKMTLVLLKGDVQAGVNLALLLDRFEHPNVGHQLLAMVDGVTIWYLLILSLGVSKITQRTFGTAGLWIVGFWVVTRGGMALGSAWWAGLQAGG